MKSFSSLIVASSVLSLAACVGGIENGGGNGSGSGSGSGGGEAKSMFNATVAPLMNRCSGCHINGGAGQAFLGTAANASSYYTSLTSETWSSVINDFRPTNALLLEKGAHSNVTWWTTAEKATITDWLEAEMEERDIDPDPNGGGGGTATGYPKSADAAMRKWASCMTVSKDIWDNTYGLIPLANQGADGTPCYVCHGAGNAANRLFLDNDKNKTYDANRTATYIRGLFVASQGGDGNWTVKMATEKFSAKSNETAGHPNYNYPSDRFNKVEEFYNQVLAKYNLDSTTDPNACGATDQYYIMP